MKNAYTYVSRVPSHYVGDDCAQVMIWYREYMTMFNKRGIQYHYSPENVINVNGYLNDDRRFNFPYYDIPKHIERRFFRKYNVTNQLLNYEESYVTISGNSIVESVAVLNKDEALVVNNVLPIKRRTINVNREELDNLFKKDKDTYILRVDGSACNENYSFSIVTEDDILRQSRDILYKDLDRIKELTSINLEYFDFTKDWIEKNIDGIIEKISIDTIPKVPLDVHDGVVVVKIIDGLINVSVIEEVMFLGPNQYRVVVRELPMMDKKITIDTLRMLKIDNIKEPIISRKLNPNIDRGLVEENKRLVKRLK